MTEYMAFCADGRLYGSGEPMKFKDDDEAAGFAASEGINLLEKWVDQSIVAQWTLDDDWEPA